MMTKIEKIIFNEGYEEGAIAEKRKQITSAVQMCKELGVDKLNILKQLPEKFSITEQEANEYIQTVWN